MAAGCAGWVVIRVIHSLLYDMDSKISMHDFRVVSGPTHVNLIFDVLVPFQYHLTDKQLEAEIREAVKTELGEEYFCAINVDKGYVGEQDWQ
ncbi:MAG: hypothetical protein LUC83_09090 [Clostridiales bacterium]|nr:hypothetical protein [Clostridiales bacterium]